MGNKILRQRLKGPALAAYYPRKLWSLRDMTDKIGPALETMNDEEDERLEQIARYALAPLLLGNKESC